MALDSNDIVVGGRLRATLTLPEAKAVDLRLFDISGKAVLTIADGPAGPGTVIYAVDAKDDNGQPLGAGTYYLRVMTAWFSRVEPIQIH
jgi:flagellar hook assembly protein FlgD